VRVVYLPSDFDAPGCYRLMFPARQMALKGNHDVVMPRFTESRSSSGRMKYETDLRFDPPIAGDIWMIQQRNERLWAEGGVRTLRHHGIAVVADVDDNYVELPEYNPAFLGGHPYRRDDGVILNRDMRRHVKRTAGFKVEPNMHNRVHMHKTFEQVDMLTVSTPYLAEIYSRFAPEIRVVRNFLDWDIWEDVQPQYEVERERLRIGYLGTFRFRQADLSLVRDVIPRVLRRYPQVDFVANSEDVHDYLGIPSDRRITEPEYHFYPPGGGEYPVGKKTAVLDIGLVPLLRNGLNEGKSHLKGMEYNAAGVPFVATPTESYADYWCPNEDVGLLAENEGQWESNLCWLIENDYARRRMGELGRKKAEEHTIQKNWWRWEEVFQDVLGDSFTKIARKAIDKEAVQKVSELSSLLRLASDKPPKVVVEIGSAGGGTFWAFCQIAADDALIISIDMPAGSPIDQRGGKDVYQRPGRDTFYEHALGNQKVILIDGNSQTTHTRDLLIDALNGHKIDLLFIDADHRYEGVKRDFELYSPLVAPGGIIGFHDIGKQNQKLARVDKFWKEVKRNHESREFFGKETWGWGHWGGIGVLHWEESRSPALASVR
jgi:predicted O-methyltransferase YrrM